MDTSETYVKMCGKAEEIQKLRNHIFIEGDYCHCKDCGTFIHYEGRLYDFDGIVWLPRQDQLQEMMGSDWIKTFDSFTWWVDSRYGTGVDEFYFEKCDDFTSIEQLWLAFVMSELYKKTWDGGDWVKGGVR